MQKQSRFLGPKRTLRLHVPKDIADRLARECARGGKSLSLVMYEILREKFPDPLSDLMCVFEGGGTVSLYERGGKTFVGRPEVSNPLPTRVESLEDLRDLQGQQGNWDHDPYMHGLYNGLELALATMQGRDTKFKDPPVHYLNGSLPVWPAARGGGKAPDIAQDPTD